MTPSIALCADSESMKQPALLGLAGENFAAQEWLALYSTAEEARASLRADAAVEEVWVASSDDMDPINLAAAVKRDRQARGVYLLAFQGTGSLWSRAHAAGVDATLSHQAFVERYLREKRRRAVPRTASGCAGERCDVPASGAVRAEGVREDAGCARPAGAAAATGSLRAANAAKGAPPAWASAVPTVVETPAAATVPGAPAAAGALERPAAAASAQSRAEAARPRLDVQAPAQRQAFLLPVASGSGGAGKERRGPCWLPCWRASWATRRCCSTSICNSATCAKCWAFPTRWRWTRGWRRLRGWRIWRAKAPRPALLAAPRRLRSLRGHRPRRAGTHGLPDAAVRRDCGQHRRGARREEHAVLLEAQPRRRCFWWTSAPRRCGHASTQ